MTRLNLALAGATSLTLAAALTLAATPTLAAAPPPAGVFNWTGVYVGLQAGYGWGDAHDNFNATLALPGLQAMPDSHRVHGYLGGVNAGYDWQAQRWVLGVAADVNLTDTSGKVSTTFNTGEGTGISSMSLRNTWQSTFRARAGYLVGNALIYATGGVAVGDARMSFGLDNPANFGMVTGRQSRTLVGWTAGGGVQFPVCRHWTVGVEGRYLSLGESDFELPANLGHPNYRGGFNQGQGLFVAQFHF